MVLPVSLIHPSLSFDTGDSGENFPRSAGIPSPDADVRKPRNTSSRPLLTQLLAVSLTDLFAYRLRGPVLPHSYLPLSQEYPLRTTPHLRFHFLLLVCPLYCFPLSFIISASSVQACFTLAITVYGHTTRSHTLSFSSVRPYFGFDLYSRTFYTCTSLGSFMIIYVLS